MKSDLIDFIKKNIPLCIKKSSWSDYPYTVPCVGEGFTDFYYWDTYFTNFMLLQFNIEQAKNNIGVFRHFVRKLGFVPNIDILKDRSQPPFYIAAVYDYYIKTNDLAEIEKNYPYMVKEYNFWMTKRITPVGLNRWFNNSNNSEDFKNFYYGVTQGILDQAFF